MAQSTWPILCFAAIPALSIVVGGVVAAFRQPSASVRSAVQHAAAGVLFAALAVELLPDVMHRNLPLVTFAGFALGVATMLAVKAWSKRLEAASDAQEPSRLPLSLLGTMAIDVLLDGLLVGVGFAGSQKEGVLLTLALTLEVLFLGVSAAAALSSANASRMMIISVSGGLSALLLAGAGAGTAFLSLASPLFIDGVMSFGIAALLYLVTEELLTEAHEVGETPLLTSMFFLGFIVLMMVEMFL